MAIRTDKAAKPVGAYVHAKEAGDLVFLSGVGPRHPETDDIPDGIEAQTHATFSNVMAILEAAGLKMSNVIDIMVFLTNMERDFKKFNSIYAQYLEGYETTRTTVEVGALPTPIAVEFKVVAKKRISFFWPSKSIHGVARCFPNFWLRDSNHL